MKNFTYLLLCAGIFVFCTTSAQAQFSIKNQEGIVGLKINKNGEIYGGKGLIQLVGRIREDGRIMGERDKHVATMTKYALLDPTGRTLVRITSQGEIDNAAGMTIKWSKDGELLKDRERTGMSMIPNDPKQYKTASAILFLFLMGYQPEDMDY